MKKHLLLGLLALIGLLSSCSKDETAAQSNPESNRVSLTASLPADMLPAATRAVPESPIGHKLRCVLEVWNNDLTEVVLRKETLVTGDNIKFEFKLETPADYNALLWADYIDEDASETDGHFPDKYYFTTDATGGLKKVSRLSYSIRVTGDEHDAFCAKQPFTKGNGALDDLNATLTRPLSKLTIAEKNDVNFSYCQSLDARYTVPLLLDVSTGDVSGTLNVYCSGAPEGSEITIKGVPCKVLFSDYVFTSPSGGVMGDIALRFTPKADSHKKLKDVTIPSGIPTKRNYHVNAGGNLIVAEDEPSSNVVMLVDVDDVWGTPDEEYDIPDVMRFTIDLTNFSSDPSYILPFRNDGTTGDYTLTVNWGDGRTQTIPPGTDLADDISHTYDAAQPYTITIASSQTDVSQEQIPDFVPGSSRTVNNNALKLVSMDTPMLNTGRTNFSLCFSDCTGLTSIPSGLFDKHTAVTSFWSCFKGCSSLSSIPLGLFDKHTAVASFVTCFLNCTSLTSIPSRLFEKNLEATDFSNCFSGCTKAVLNADIFCVENEETKQSRFQKSGMNFTRCFDNCGSDLQDGGKAPALWEYTFNESVNSANCFHGATKLTNYAVIPNTWGGPAN